MHTVTHHHGNSAHLASHYCIRECVYYSSRYTYFLLSYLLQLKFLTLSTPNLSVNFELLLSLGNITYFFTGSVFIGPHSEVTKSATIYAQCPYVTSWKVFKMRSLVVFFSYILPVGCNRAKHKILFFLQNSWEEINSNTYKSNVCFCTLRFVVIAIKLDFIWRAAERWLPCLVSNFISHEHVQYSLKI